jgi:hypothetical protein
VRFDEARVPALNAGGVTGGFDLSTACQQGRSIPPVHRLRGSGQEAEDAVAALAFLQAEKMDEVAGEEIRVTARFWTPAAV